MPLFTPSESYALQSFLEHIDISSALEGISAGEAEWPAIYSAGSDTSSGLHQHLPSTPATAATDLHHHHLPRIASPTETEVSSTTTASTTRFAGEETLVPRDSRSEQLAKAAKDLMSLDSNPLKWTDSADHDLPCPPPPPRPPQSSRLGHTRSGSATHFSSSTSNGRPRLAVTSSSAYESLASGSSVNSSSDTSPPPLTPPSAKRPYDAIHDPSSSNAYAKKPRPSSSSTSASASSSSQQQSHTHPTHPNIPIINTKPTLLSASQKKANHIQSEQKRRANIRKGYEALCDTVPALREAIRREEEEQRMLASAGPSSASAAVNGGADSAGKVKKKLRARRKVTDGGERMDGRAGPKSENIVLSKTIDYIHELLSDKSALLERLGRARTMLGRNNYHHTAHPPPSIEGGVPLWDREWGGGVGLLDPDGADSDDGGEDS